MSPKKIKWLIAGMAALLAVSIGGYIAVDSSMKKKEKAAQDEADSLILFDFESDSISHAVLDTEDGHFQFDMTDGQWVLTDTDYDYKFDINEFYLTVLCNYMSTLTAEKKFEIAAEDLDKYGLKNPMVLELSDGMTSHTLYLGDTSATQEYVFAMVPGDDMVYGVPFQTGGALYATLSSLKTPNLVNCLDVDINAISLQRGGDTVFDIKEEESGWRMLAPIRNGDIDNSMITSLCSSLSRLQISEYLELKSDSTDLKAYGLDKPQYRLDVSTNDGKRIGISFSECIDDSYYILYDGTGEIARLEQNQAAFLQTEVGALMSSTVLSLSVESVSALDVKVEDVEFHMEFDIPQQQFSMDGIDIDEMGEDAISLMSSLYNTVTNLKHFGIDPDGTPDTSQEAEIRFLYTLTDGSTREVQLLPKEENVYYAVIDGEYGGKLVRRRSLSDNTGVLTYYDRMKELIYDYYGETPQPSGVPPVAS